MRIAALVTWLITVAGGFYLLATWLAGGGLRRQPAGATRFPAPVIFGHFLLAAVGLILWISYLIATAKGLAWAAFIVLVPVALLGFTMLARWLPGYRAGARPGHAADWPAARASGGTATATTVTTSVPAESHFPVAAVLGHGAFAAATLVLVLLAALGVGGR